MPTLPRPQVHYDVVTNWEDSPYRVISALSESIQTAILVDPYNNSGTNPLPMREGLEVSYNTIRSVIAYVRSGQQVVVVGPRMQEAFTNTSLRDVPTEHLRLPYQCFYLATPGCELTIWDKTTGWHRIVGAYVMELPVDHTQDRVISIVLWGAPNENSKSPGDDSTFWITFRVVGVQDLDDTFRRILSFDGNECSDLGMGGTPEAIKAQVYPNVWAYVRMAINALLFLNSKSCETSREDPDEATRRELTKALARKKHQKGKEARKLQNKLNGLPRYHITWLGPSIETRETNTEGGESGSIRGHMRRGHWHTFHTGPRKTAAGDRIDPADQTSKLLWVAPMWVEGKAPAADGPRVYGVREPAQ